MEGNGYLMPLRNNRRYTPYEFDLKMSQNEERMSRLGKIIDQDIFYSLMSHRKTPSVTTGPNYVVENKKEFNPLNSNFNPNNFSRRKEMTPRNDLMKISSNSFKIPRSPGYDTINPVRQFREPEKEMLNDNRRYANNNIQDERLFDEPTNSFRKRNNDNQFNDFIKENKYPRMMNNEFNNSRNVNNNKYNDFDYEMANKRFSPYNQPRRLINNNNFRSQEISKINYDVPKSPINYEAKEENNYMNNGYKNSFRERMNDINLNDMKPNNKQKLYNPNEQRYGMGNNNIRRKFYNSQLNFPPKEEEEF